MDRKATVDIDNQIIQLEKQLASLYAKRVAALEGEIERAKARIGAFGGSAGVEAPVAKAPAVSPVKRKGRPARKQAVRAKTASKPVPAVKEPKAEPVAQPVVEAPAAAPAKKSRKPRQPKKRTRTPTAVVEAKILDALKESGLFGLSQIEISQKTGLGYQTIVQKLKKLPDVVKKGSLKEGRFFLKA